MTQRDDTKMLKPHVWMLRQALKHSGMTQEQFAAHIGVKRHTIRSILYQGTKITPEMATKFESMLGGSASFWMQLQETTK